MNVNRQKLVVVAFAIFALTVWLYWPSTRGGFLVYMDDDEYLREAVRWNGLTWSAVQWAFTCTQPYWQPLARLSHVLDYQMWGTNAAGHHASSVILHAFNAALVFGFLWSLLSAVSLTASERLTLAAGVAAVFAIHPLQVETVAWMSCRTQLLCGTFGIGCVWAYAAGARRRVVWGLYAAALLSSPMAVSLPFVMLAMDYFPLRRYEQVGWGRLLRDNALLVALAVGVGVATMVTESRTTAPWETISASERVLLMLQSLVFYSWKLVWPGQLSTFFPLWPGLSLYQRRVLASALGVGAITAAVVVNRRRWPAVATAWGSYVALVLPVSGLLQTALFAVAARYAYLAIVPLVVAAGGAGIWLWRRSASVARLGLVGVMVFELGVFGARTRSLIPEWRDSETVWRAALAQFPNSVIANRALAMTLLGEGRIKKALQYAQREVELAPQSAEAHMTLSVVLGRLGRLQDAVEQCEEAVRLKPDSAEAQSNLANALVRTGKIEEALGHYEQSLRIEPGSPEMHCNLGSALAEMGKRQEAIAQFEQALRLRPDFAAAKDALAALQSRP